MREMTEREKNYETYYRERDILREMRDRRERDREMNGTAALKNCYIINVGCVGWGVRTITNALTTNKFTTH